MSTSEKLKLSLGPIASQGVRAIAMGQADEILLLGPRGEAKTISALIATAYHAKIHEETGFILNDEGIKIPLTLPVPWMCITDTFNAHKEKTLESIKKSLWQGAWRVEDGGHKAILKTNKDAVVISLFGIEDNTALDRARKETACSWYEEVAPTTEGSGLPEEAVDIGITSQRVPTHAAITLLTSNYPDDDHWLWKRFKPIMGKYGLNVHPEDPRRITFQIPKGDNPFITAAQRAKWLERLKDRPDLISRLLEGRPSVVHKGQAVAMAFIGDQPIGYNESKHLSQVRLKPVEKVPFILGQDGGHCMDSHTEILTKEGWFLFKDLPDIKNTLFATLNPFTRELEYTKAIQYVKFSYKGLMYEWAGENVNICVTPEHSVPWISDHDKNEVIRWSTAQEIVDMESEHVCVPLTCEWNGGIDDSMFGWSALTFAKFMGWYLSEGNTESNTNRVSIAQSKSDHINDLLSVLAETDLEWSQSETRFRASDKELADYLKQFGLQPERFVPQIIKDLSKESLLAFVNAYTKGDGTLRDRASHGEVHVINTSSKKMADDFQEIALKLGWSSSVEIRPPTRSWYEAEQRWIVSNIGYRVRFKKSFSNAHLLPKNLSIIDYEGDIYCVTVPYHTLYIRRRGKPSWTGNTPATTGIQDVNGVLRVLFSMCISRGGMRQQYKHNVIPWFRKYAPWVLEDPDEYVLGCYDSSMPDDESDTERVDKNPIDVIKNELGGLWLPGPNDWDSRKGALFAAFNRSVGGDAAIQIDPLHCDGLLKALRGQWHYATDRFGSVQNDKPKSPNHPHEDYGQSFCYALCRVQPFYEEEDDEVNKNHHSDYDPLVERG